MAYSVTISFLQIASESLVSLLLCEWCKLFQCHFPHCSLLIGLNIMYMSNLQQLKRCARAQEETSRNPGHHFVQIKGCARPRCWVPVKSTEFRTVRGGPEMLYLQGDRNRFSKEPWDQRL